MPARIEKEFLFDTAVHFENNFLINNFYLYLHMTVNTDSGHEQNVAIERVNYFLSNIVEHSIFISEKDKDSISKYEKAGINILTLPDEPYDQIIACILMCKLNAIMEDKIQVDQIILGSKLTAGIKFNIYFEEAEQYSSTQNWWNESTTNTQIKTKSKKEKVVKLFEQDDWKELGLIWKEKKS